jgi:hypothetical protein
MKKLMFVLFLLTSLLSCKDKKAGNIIPRDVFVDMLVDIHLADADYSMNSSKFKFHTDSANFYNDIFVKYGYDRASFDTTARYYSRHLKEFDDLYDDVVTDLNKMDQEVMQMRPYETVPSSNLYKGRRQWSLPKDGPTRMIPFSVRIKDTATYYVSVQLKLLPKDETKKPRLTVFFWYNDGSKEGYRDKFSEVAYKKTSRSVVYTTSLKLKNKKVTHIKGFILDDDNADNKHPKYVEIKNIVVSSSRN